LGLYDENTSINLKAIAMNLFEQVAVENFVYAFVLIGIFLWIYGYKNPDSARQNAPLDFLRSPVILPKVLFILCAQPVSRKYHRGIMTAYALSAQLMGYGFCVLGLLAFLLKPSILVVVTSLVLMIGLVFAIAQWATQNRPYKPGLMQDKQDEQ